MDNQAAAIALWLIGIAVTIGVGYWAHIDAKEILEAIRDLAR